MSRRRTIDLYDLIERISLSQKIAGDHREYEEYSGSDTELSKKIAVLNVLIKHKILDKNDKTIKLAKDLLCEKRKAVFASSDKTDVFTKLGFLRPRKEKKINLAIGKGS